MEGGIITCSSLNEKNMFFCDGDHGRKQVESSQSAKESQEYMSKIITRYSTSSAVKSCAFCKHPVPVILKGSKNQASQTHRPVMAQKRQASAATVSLRNDSKTQYLLDSTLRISGPRTLEFHSRKSSVCRHCFTQAWYHCSSGFCHWSFPKIPSPNMKKRPPPKMPQVLQIPRPPPLSCPHRIASRSQNIVESCLGWIPRGGQKFPSARWNVGVWKIIQKELKFEFECKNLFESRIEVLRLKNLWLARIWSDSARPFSLKENNLKPTWEEMFQVHTCWQATFVFIAIPFQSQAMLCIARTFHYKARPCATMGHGNVHIKI